MRESATPLPPQTMDRTLGTYRTFKAGEFITLARVPVGREGWGHAGGIIMHDRGWQHQISWDFSLPAGDTTIG